MAIGEAARIAAALAVKQNLPPHEIQVSDIQQCLKMQGHLLSV